MKHPIPNIPSEPGCYLFVDSHGTIMYVGKAKNLKKRVANYFAKKGHDTKTAALVRHIHDVDFFVTKTEVEALILENTLIKKHHPKYNIDLRDSRSYAYIEETQETFPRLTTFRTTTKDTKRKLYGPFTSGTARNDVLQILNKTFKLRTCKKLPTRACLRYSMGICSAPCIKNISEEAYAYDVNAAVRVINGNIDEVMNNLRIQMKHAAHNEQFEHALKLRDQITSLEYLHEKQTMERRRTFNEDIINYHHKDDKIYLIVFNIYKGTLHNKQEFTFKAVDDPLASFIKEYYAEHDIPKEIIIPHVIDPAIQAYLSKKKGSSVTITIPKKGDKKTLLDLVLKNIELSFFRHTKVLEDLQKALNLPDIPHTIECFDISHLAGTNIVASMVQFREGKPDKTNYRRFKMKTVKDNDDFASMREVVHRRYRALKKDNAPLPDLIIIDGGQGQLSAAMSSLKDLGLTIPIISLAKKEEEIYLPEGERPLQLGEKSPARLIIQQIRDEAHRFAIKYNRLLRDKERFTPST